MSKPKAFLKHSKAKKKAEQVLETADDFQAAGVDFEEAAGKWRAGDAVKSMRFFSRAIDVYDRGLQKFPNSLDLAYNKARVLLEVATHPVLVQQLQAPLLEVLQQALDAHRYALNLDQDNADALFNTAQVLTTIAEVYAKDPERPDQDALRPLEEALELQNRCLAIQELKLEESIQQQNEADAQTDAEDLQPALSEDNNDNIDDSDGTPANNKEEQWFSVVEPVTKETLIDTILAQLGTLTTLCSILSSTATSAPITSLVWVEEFSSKLIRTKLPVLVQDAESETVQEVALAKATFISTLLEAGYRTGSIDAPTYKKERDEAFKESGLNLEKNFAALLANANSLVSYNAALADRDSMIAESQAPQRWNALSAAIANMASASKISGPVPDDVAETHFMRGNCSLLQVKLGHPPVSYQPAITNAAQLLKNADTFYRNASKLYQDEEQKAISQLRGTVSRALLAGTDLETALTQANLGQSSEWIRSQVQDMLEDGLIALNGER
ncbi:hypothetical protein LTR10_022878 [Elasticomyces elasticus]|uniref:Uncharacterized protein n=1 Tax=Exophiala sideris TaxID=1016849 RepID=A0ABR0J8W3_9EURO|nr:hypothetical protein LTR10_022878 [Elasticomyces elasticus]KAK5022212.1 hypothetical protein LTS07_010292 [Exophiala sideris]KAK5037346.1 hypothetical protein LTR13_004502 [Exophiala sideris]KAK5059010.1 hypothetical protein LTR69_006297 [Exophiala sideris]KAK5182842.1 hypothetical protein LTR44_004550 [Eurotiomycetes sp. CCFEE 6388]